MATWLKKSLVVVVEKKEQEDSIFICVSNETVGVRFYTTKNQFLIKELIVPINLINCTMNEQ